MLPSNVSTFSATNTGNSSFFAGSTIANLRGLNPFFGSRTLNLVNGRRFVPTNQGDGVDLNFIPFVLVDRVDVVTGGASAAYGSGAISGVNNVILNRKLEGGRRADGLRPHRSRAMRNDRHIGLAYGSGLFDDRGHFIIGYEYQQSDAIGCDRDFCKEGNGFVQNPLAGQPGQPSSRAGAERALQPAQPDRRVPELRSDRDDDAAGSMRRARASCRFSLPSAALRRHRFRSTTCRVATANRSTPYNNLRAPVRRNVVDRRVHVRHHRRHAHEPRPVVRQGGDRQSQPGAGGRTSAAITPENAYIQRQCGSAGDRSAPARCSTRTGPARSTRTRTPAPK